MPKFDLSIDKIEEHSKLGHPKVFHPYLPQHAFSMIIIAPKGSGKTNLLANLIMKHYKGYFNDILVSSPTIDNDEKWDIVKKTKGVLKQNKKLEKTLNNLQKTGRIKKVVYCSEGSLAEQESKKEKWQGLVPEENFFPDIESVPSRIQEQQKLLEKLKKIGIGPERRFIIDRQLLILDDQAGMFKSGSTNNPMANLVIKHRHTSTSIIIVTQAYKAIPKTIRTNCNAIILFDIANTQELKVIYEEYPAGMVEKDWLNVYRHATHEPYSFLYMNYKFPKGERIFKNLDKMLAISSQSNDSIENIPLSKDSKKKQEII